jgi:hypothetical protein
MFIRKFILLSIFVGAVLVTNCHYKPYTGKKLPPDQIAQLDIRQRMDLTVYLDGKKIKRMFAIILEILPGQHILTVTPGGSMVGEPMTLVFEAKAGHKYRLLSGTKMVEETPRVDDYTYIAFIEDSETGELASKIIEDPIIELIRLSIPKKTERKEIEPSPGYSPVTKPTDREVFEAVSAYFKSEVPPIAGMLSGNYVVRVLTARVLLVDVVKVDSRTETEILDMTIRCVGRCILDDPFNPGKIVYFDRIGEFILYKDDYGKWQAKLKFGSHLQRYGTIDGF